MIDLLTIGFDSKARQMSLGMSSTGIESKTLAASRSDRPEPLIS